MFQKYITNIRGKMFQKNWRPSVDLVRGQETHAQPKGARRAPLQILLPIAYCLSLELLPLDLRF